MLQQKCNLGLADYSPTSEIHCADVLSSPQMCLQQLNEIAHESIVCNVITWGLVISNAFTSHCFSHTYIFKLFANIPTRALFSRCCIFLSKINKWQEIEMIACFLHNSEFAFEKTHTPEERRMVKFFFHRSHLLSQSRRILGHASKKSWVCLFSLVTSLI